MKISLKDILKIALSVGLTIFVIYKTSGDVNWDELKTALQEFEYGWIVLSMLLGILSHYLRAYRWTLLINSGNHKTSTSNAFLAVMVGYLANTAIPRLGEVVRCSVLNTEDRIPVSFSIGTVITDRLVDLLMLGLFTVFLLLSQFELLHSFFASFVDEKMPFLASVWPFLLLGGILGTAVIIIVLKKARTEADEHKIFYKIALFIQGLWEGVKSVGKVYRPLHFWASTAAIWLLYFLMLYVISFGFAPTDDLSFMAGISVLVMGSLGMATPVNNGIGAYQAFVASILVLYGIKYSDGYIFAVISHGSHLVSVLLVGFVSLLILNFRRRKKGVVNK